MTRICRGTTPDITCRVLFDLDDYECMFTIGAKPLKPYFTVRDERITRHKEDGYTYLTFTLTQDETLSCKAGNALAQRRAVKGPNSENAVASVYLPVEIIDIVKDGVIYHAE